MKGRQCFCSRKYKAQKQAVSFYLVEVLEALVGEGDGDREDGIGGVLVKAGFTVSPKQSQRPAPTERNTHRHTMSGTRSHRAADSNQIKCWNVCRVLSDRKYHFTFPGCLPGEAVRGLWTNLKTKNFGSWRVGLLCVPPSYVEGFY